MSLLPPRSPRALPRRQPREVPDDAGEPRPQGAARRTGPLERDDERVLGEVLRSVLVPHETESEPAKSRAERQKKMLVVFWTIADEPKVERLRSAVLEDGERHLHRVGLARDGRAVGVADGQHAGTLLAGVPQRHQGVHRLHRDVAAPAAHVSIIQDGDAEVPLR